MNKKWRIGITIIMIFSLIIGGYLIRDFYYAKKFNGCLKQNKINPDEFPSKFKDKILFNEGRLMLPKDQNKSLEYFQKIIGETDDKFLKAESLYNLGCIFTIRGLQEKTAEKKANLIATAIDYHKESLRLRPDFWEAKYNLETLLKLSEKTNQKQPKNQEGNKKSDKQKKQKNDGPEKNNKVKEGEEEKRKEVPPSSNPEFGNEI